MTSNWDTHQKSNELQVKLWQNKLQLKEATTKLMNLQHEFDQHKDQSAAELANIRNVQGQTLRHPEGDLRRLGLPDLPGQ
ncbi:hypothetical protein L226DRAFT_571825 [Lentinus tigrinus ALCF2SS1-7]|uniref:Uncharacterized protein n=1 Tax=Lentinus tigrinus ALCF2SS1-6 TaxID=1328759 RepID=A0A5C2RVP0_9APHY|nr:hypothetical protein L227DRAFT_616031 [Lentinus tigrinus ALCF2SS1-6]RPD73919.1 hypothetical protein L226DRAFT_571825 [Lentinus tigrinus ALCF2SS1-7]